MKNENLNVEAVETANVLTTEQKSLFKMILEAVKYYNDHQSLKPVTTPIYRNKTNPSDFIEYTESALAEAFKANKLLADYELVEENFNPNLVLKEMIFGKDKVPALTALPTFIKACEAASGKKEMNAAKQKVYNVASGAITKVTLEDAIAEATSVYAQYGKTFSYNPDSRKGKKAETKVTNI